MKTIRYTQKILTTLFTPLSFFCLLILGNCTSYTLDESQAKHISLEMHVKSSTENKPENILKFSPVIKVFDANQSFNKIGTPSVKSDGSVYINSEQASFYTHEQTFKIEDREYTNLIYRIHFSEIPFSIVPYHLSTGKNVGLIFIVTLNSKKQPILFTVSHTCGCYKAIMATSFTPESFYPDNWKNSQQKVYGERLPSILSLTENKPDVCAAIRPQEHRVMDIYPCDKNQTQFESAQLYSLKSLRSLPTKDGPVSFFHEDGIQEGFVKGAIKPWESLMLSWPSMDFFVGTDKAFLRPESSDNTFYTSLKPWNRDKSDMANFPAFLKYWGWNL